MQRDRLTATLLRVAAFVLIFWALHEAKEVFAPVAFALFAIGFFWPLYRRAERLMPEVLAAVVVFVAALVVLGLLGAGLYYSADQIASEVPRMRRSLEDALGSLSRWAADQGVSLPTTEGIVAQLSGTLRELAAGVVGAGIGIFLVLAFMVLGIIEVHDVRRRITGDERMSGFYETVSEIARDFQRYIGARTLVGLITGAFTALTTWMIGLEYPLVWGLANLLLNYIPTVGSVVGVVPPALFALATGGAPDMLLAVAAVGGTQLFMGNYVDPLVQGKVLSLSPFVVLFAVTFFSWLWGITGAFLTVPIVVAFVLVCERFEGARWLSTLLAERPVGEGRPTVIEDLRRQPA